MDEIDATDRRILNHLLLSGRDSYRDIAKALGLAPATIMKRVKELEKAGIIRNYGAVLDYEKLGYDIRVIVDVRVAKGKLFQIEKRIAKHPNVFSVYDNTGSFDATVIARFKNRSGMDKFLKELQTYDFVERTETKLVLSTIKEESTQLS